MHPMAIHALLAACVASATASPAEPQFETVAIRHFAAHIVNSGGTSRMGIRFTLHGHYSRELECAADDMDIWRFEVYNCGESKYRFAVFTSADVSTFLLRIYHLPSSG